MASADGRDDLGCDGRGGNADRVSTLAGCPRDLPQASGDPVPPGTRLRGVSPAADTAAPARVLVYSHRPEVRAAVRTAVGRRPASDVGPLTYVECSTGAEVVAAVDSGDIDLCILDGEAQPTGGLALARQLEQEVADRPAVCVLIARQPDRWLAHWSRAEGTLALPVDPLVAPGVVADLLRDRARRPVRR
jgi:CheY-like chemotaxis protein